MGSTEANGYSVGKSGERPTGSIECNSFDYSKVGGRPIHTTKLSGFGVGLSGGVYGAQSNMLFKLRMISNSPMNGIIVLKLNIDDCCVNVHLELCSKECLIVNYLLLLWSNVMESQSCPLFWPYYT